MDQVSEEGEELKMEAGQWRSQAPAETERLSSYSNGFLIRWLMDEIDYHDKRLVDDLLWGFPFVGWLPPGAGGVSEAPLPQGTVTVDELRRSKHSVDDGPVKGWPH